MRHVRFAALGVAVLLGARLAAQQAPADTGRFDHAKHAKVFVTCTVCHAGAATAGAPLFPDSAACATCHNGTVRPAVSYRTPPDTLRSNLRFSHAAHRDTLAARGDTTPDCVQCHTRPGAPWMAVEPPVVERCFNCHRIPTAHLEAPDSACARCHVPLPSAPRLTAADVAAFPEPPSHRRPGFMTAAGHGALARAGSPVAASCATCHARDFCLQCHVDAPERATIQALAPDPRALAIRETLRAPASHAAPGFLDTHGATARRAPETCATCHTRQSCLTCHYASPRVADALHPAGPGRATGAVIARHAPPSHAAADWVRRHAPTARAAATTCAACHARSDCVECHRPDPARAAGFHPPGFLARHPAAAYARETSCSGCHNTGQFCVSCHRNAGLVAQGGPLRAGFHDVSAFFLSGHGVVARQSLETCVSCHTERDCLTCHSALGGRMFDPHGPGFDPSRLVKKNPEVCTACHGSNIPTR